MEYPIIASTLYKALGNPNPFRMEPETPLLECPKISPQNLEFVEVGTFNTPNYRGYMKDENGAFVSLWHDVPVFAPKEAEDSTQFYNMIVTGPRYTNARVTISHTEPMNPLVHMQNPDGSLDYERNIFPHHGFPFNTGLFPQTYTDSVSKSAGQPSPGDGNMLDALDLSRKTRKLGEIVKVRVIGTMSFIVNNQLDWKVICADAADPIWAHVKDMQCLELVMPGITRSIYEFFYVSSIPKTGLVTQAAFRGACHKADTVHQMLSISHKVWKNVINQLQHGVLPETVVECRQEDAKIKADLEKWRKIVEDAPEKTEPAAAPDYVESYYYIRCL
ncbi:hypothetical protein L596_028235 [Steinernema carpocapsae]|uniref:inorganic diphosphatase n=1 Tax=Steinernema carpocapsae TaxID=34508 RepID=A0A4U5LXT9_STECR|nr:hypothetical protein L596_028235 [Steinernema carpocapsae]